MRSMSCFTYLIAGGRGCLVSEVFTDSVGLFFGEIVCNVESVEASEKI